MNIPFFNYPRAYLDDQDDLLRIFKDVGSRGAFILQRDLKDFEDALSAFTGAGYAMGVGNATDGLELALLTMGLKKGDEVICSSHTMIATAAAIKIAGANPILVDIRSDGLIDPDAVEDAISSRTVGVLPTHLNGRTCEMDRLMSIANRNSLFVIEDAAQALGSRYKGRHAGTFGSAGAISFYPAKVLGCLGDGGAVICNDSLIYDRLYQWHDHGRDQSGEVRSWGRNSRLDNLQAAILNFRLSSYKNIIERRRAIAAIYQDQLSSLEGLMLPPKPEIGADNFDIYQNYEIQADRRDELREYLKQKQIGTLIQWGGKAVHQWENLGFKVKLPVTEEYFRRCLMLPMNVFLSNDEIYQVCSTIKTFYGERNA
jgi:dTDP-4-amino-4,6-dideoxygalactose transaminase